jgi:glycosyltransferase involved in cell wall biosynthesis
VTRPLELALAADDVEAVAQLRSAGWRVVEARPLSKDIDAYRRYIRGSAGELSAAKEQNVRLRSGWFSDRSASYLAAGRPVVLQDTGFGCALPTGAGLFAFRTMDEAAAALAEIEADYRRHAQAAYAIAAEHLRAETVLSELLEAL